MIFPSIAIAAGSMAFLTGSAHAGHGHTQWGSGTNYTYQTLLFETLQREGVLPFHFESVSPVSCAHFSTFSIRVCLPVDGELLEVQGTIPEWLFGSKRHNGFGKYESAEAGKKKR
jgi:hypothetical protein